MGPKGPDLTVVADADALAQAAAKGILAQLAQVLTAIATDWTEGVPVVVRRGSW